MRAFPNLTFLIALLLVASPACCSAQANTTDNPRDLTETLTLERCLELALQNNFDIQKAKERIVAQHGVVVESRGRFYPALDMVGDFTRLDAGRIQSFQGQSFGTKNYWTADITVEHAFYTGGKDSALLERERLSERAAAFDLAGVINTVLATVKERFYGVLLAQAQIEVQRENVKLLEEELRYERNKLEAGTVSDFNVLRAEVALANSKTPLIRAENALPLAQEELRRVLGVPLSDAEPDRSAQPLAVQGILSFSPLDLTLEQALKTAQKDRPELQSLALTIDAAAKSKRAVEAEYLPSFAWSASYGADKSQFTTSLDDEVHGWRAGLEARWNLFNGLQTEGRVAQAESSASQARISSAQTRLDIEVEVRRAFSAFTEAQALVNASTQVVTQAEESLRLARARSAAGSATQLDVLDSQVALTEARTNKVQALYDYNLAVTQMEKALGKLVSTASDVK